MTLDNVQEQIEVDETLCIGIHFGAQAGKLHARPYFFQIELDFHERKAAGITRDGQFTDQPTIGVILMVVSIEESLPHLLEEFRHCRIA